MLVLSALFCPIGTFTTLTGAHIWSPRFVLGPERAKHPQKERYKPKKEQ